MVCGTGRAGGKRAEKATPQRRSAAARKGVTGNLIGAGGDVVEVLDEVRDVVVAVILLLRLGVFCLHGHTGTGQTLGIGEGGRSRPRGWHPTGLVTRDRRRSGTRARARQRRAGGGGEWRGRGVRSAWRPRTCE